MGAELIEDFFRDCNILFLHEYYMIDFFPFFIISEDKMSKMNNRR